MTFLLHPSDIYRSGSSRHQVVEIWNKEDPACDAGHRPEGGQRAKKKVDRSQQCPVHGADGGHRERQMTYLSNVANERPMLRISATIILAFTCAAPFVLLISGVVGYGVRSLIH